MTVQLAEKVDAAVNAYRDGVLDIALDLWRLAEPSLLEVRSSALMAQALEEHGFSVVSRNTSGIPTAFIAEWGRGEPRLGILLEYDALPGLGNEAVPSKTPRADGVTAGHGCGHNLIGAAAYGAALGLKRLMEAEDLKGTLRVYGCAAEETEGAKVYMARDGLFDDLDGCVHCHPWEDFSVAQVCTTATNQMRIEFFGTTAHAGNAPWLGRSAVDAAELFTHGVNLMREHVEPTARLHYVYENAGVAPNIVPDYARLWLTSRDADVGRVTRTSAWLRQIANGAAMATQTRADVDIYFGMANLIPNTPLAQRMQAHVERIGAPTWTSDEQSFAKALQKAFGVPEIGMVTAVTALRDEPNLGGSTDVGDVSWKTPTMGVGFPTLPVGISLHTWAATAVHGMSIGMKAGLQAARAMAALGADLLTDAELRAAARADLNRRLEGQTYVCAIPPDRKQPFGMPEWMLHPDGSREMLAIGRGR